MLSVGPDHEVVVAPSVHPRPQPIQPGRVELRREERLAGRHPEVRKRHVGDVCSGHAHLAHRHPSGSHGTASAAPRSIVTKLSAATGIHGPVSPSGHWTRTSASVASPSPVWSQPASPLAWPPPTVISLDVVRSSARTSSHAPTASTLGAGCSQAHGEPVPGRNGTVGVAPPDVPPHLHGLAPVHHDEVEHPVQVEIDHSGAAGPFEADDAGILSRLRERAVGAAEEEVAGVAAGVVDLGFDVALRHEQIDESVVVDVLELGVPRGRREHVTAHGGPLRGHAAGQRDVLVGGVLRSVGQGLQLVVALAGDEDLGVAVAGEVPAGDAHAPEVQRLPAVGLGVGAGRLAGLDAPHLVLAVEVVVAIVGDPQVATAGPAPVAEQHGQRAVAGGQRFRRGVDVTGCGGPDELAVVALGRVRHEVVPERQRGKRVRPLPRSAERSRPGVAAVDAQLVVGRFEAAVAQPPQHDVAAAAQDDEVHRAVAVDVERVGAGDRGQVGHGRRQLRESCRAADRALVPVERGRLTAPGQIQLGAAIVVAVERCDPAADEVLELAVVHVVDPGRLSFFHEARRVRLPRGSSGAEGDHDAGSGEERDDEAADDDRRSSPALRHQSPAGGGRTATLSQRPPVARRRTNISANGDVSCACSWPSAS